MATNEKKSTLVIVRDESVDADALAVAALDDELNLDNEGNVKSQFLPTDSPYFWVHLDTGLRITQIRCSSGSVRSLGQVTRTAEIDTLDIDEAGDEHELEYNPASEPVFEWYGNRPTVSRNGRTITFSGELPAAGRGSYTFTALSYQYQPPVLSADQNWRTRIVIHVGESS